MNNTKISIIVNTNSDISAISSLMQQNNDSWECFIINNSVKNIEQYITNNPKIKIVKDFANTDIIYETIKKAKGEYILLINSDDILTSTAIDRISDAISFTNADVIKFNSKLLADNEQLLSNSKLKFKYIFNKINPIEYVFSNIFEFCFKKDIICDSPKSEHALLTNILTNAKDMAVIKNTLIMSRNNYDISVCDIVENYNNHRNKLPENFWKDYFQHITKKIITKTVKNNDKKSFIEFCRNIPLQLIPLRYRIICYIMKKTNK